ncbi:MAG TPA: mechanosensitive ion channel domain-containing protein [Acidimicrobiales bacterium]|nr:mechanosensitive ion channel domain-containing protein [Acidimicrobiales bacterium]
MVAISLLVRPLTVSTWITAGIIVVVGVVLGQALRRLIKAQRHLEATFAHRLGRGVATSCIVLGVIVAAWMAGVRLGPLLGAIGISGFMVVYAALPVLQNNIASLSLQLRRPFDRGDYVSVVASSGASYEGTVEALSFSAMSLRAPSGDLVLVPAAQVISQPVVNHSDLGRRRSTVVTTISPDQADLVNALPLVAGNCDDVLASPPPQAWLTLEDTPKVTLSFWHSPKTDPTTEVGIAVLQAKNGNAQTG